MAFEFLRVAASSNIAVNKGADNQRLLPRRWASIAHLQNGYV